MFNKNHGYWQYVSKALRTFLCLTYLLMIGANWAYANSIASSQLGIRGFVDSFIIKEGKVKAEGWAGPENPNNKVISISIWLAGKPIYDGLFEQVERQDVANVMKRSDWIKSGWRIRCELPKNIQHGEYSFKISAKLDNGMVIDLNSLKEGSLVRFYDDTIYPFNIVDLFIPIMFVALIILLLWFKPYLVKEIPNIEINKSVSSSNRKHIILVLIVIIATSLRLIYWKNSDLSSDPNQLGKMWPDEGNYFLIANYIMNHGIKNYFFTNQSVIAAPGNPLYIAFLYTVTKSIYFIRAMNLFLSVLTIVMVYKIGQKMYGKSVGLLAAGICAVHRQLVEYSPTLLTEPIFMLFFITGIFYLVCALEKRSFLSYHYLSYALLSGIFLTISILTRSVVMLLPIFLFVVIGIMETHRSMRMGKPSFPLLKNAILPLLLPILVVGIITTKNYICFNRFMFATGSGAALWLGSRADTEGDEPPYRRRGYDTQMVTHGTSHVSIQGDTLLLEAAKQNIREHPLRYSWWDFKKIGRLMVGSNFAWFYPYKNISGWYRETGRNPISAIKMVFHIILASCIVIYGIIGLIANSEQNVFGLIIGTTVCYLIVFSIPFLAIQRYGLPLVMLLVIPAATVLCGAWQASKRWRRATLLGVPFVAVIVFQILFLG